MRSKHLSTHQMKIRHSRHITEDMKMSILPTVPIGLMLKESSATTKKARNCGTQQVRRSYLTKKKKKKKKKKLANLAF